MSDTAEIELDYLPETDLPPEPRPYQVLRFTVQAQLPVRRPRVRQGRAADSRPAGTLPVSFDVQVPADGLGDGLDGLEALAERLRSADLPQQFIAAALAASGGVWPPIATARPVGRPRRPGAR